MAEINKIEVVAPVKIKDVLIANVLGLGSNIIATRTVEK
jgi:CxxC motif-containing protein